MSLLFIAVLAIVSPPTEAPEKPARPPAVLPVEKAEPAANAEVSTRTGAELREAVRAALRRWARPSDAEADAAAREFLALYKEIQADDQLSRSQREYFVQKVRIRLMRLSDQIAVRVARAKRLAKAGPAEPVEPPDEKTGSLARLESGSGGSPGDYVPGPTNRPTLRVGAQSVPAGGPAFGGGAMGVPDNGQQLVELIQTVIRPETWDINGGPGSIYYWYPGRALVIRQMGEVHDDICGVLNQLRRAGQ